MESGKAFLGKWQVIKIILIDRGQKESEEIDTTRTRVQDVLDIYVFKMSYRN